MTVFGLLSLVLYFLGTVVLYRFASWKDVGKQEAFFDSLLWPYIAIQILFHSIFNNDEE